MKVREAEMITGGLSNPSKMPGYAWGIPAARCHRGSKLRVKEGTVCSHCYACKGRYSFSNVEMAYERRYQQYLANQGTRHWYEAMATDIASKCQRIPFFRWFDSGDLQDEGMLWSIVDVCSAVPQVNFWMSTRERGLLTAINWYIKVKIRRLQNLVIRVSADMVDAPPPAGCSHTSTVRHIPSKIDWANLVNTESSTDNWYCPAPLQGNECGDCRACWDRNVKNVTYRQH